MGMYDDLLIEKQPGGKLEKVKNLDLSKILDIKKVYPSLPDDYCSFLEDVGSGEVGHSAYVIYNGVLEPGEIYDADTAEAIGDILIFGDDMQGYCAGFAIDSGYAVVEIDPTNSSYIKIADTFSAFIRDKLGEI